MTARQTLRFRLAAWTALIVLATALTTVLGTRFGVLRAVLHELDVVLVEDSDEVALALQTLTADEFGQLRSELERKALGHRQHRWFVQLLDGDGGTVLQSGVSPDLVGRLPPQPGALPRTFADVRLYERSARENPFGVRVIRIGAALTTFHEEMARIDRLVLMTSIFAMCAAPLVGYWLASRAARALGDIVRAAARLRPTHLHERLPVRGTGDELDQLAATINLLLDRLARYLQEKRDFLADSAHELRTPLAAIRSSVEVALAAPRRPAEYQELLEIVIERTAALEILINQLLLISESEAELLQSEFTTTPLDEVVRRAVEMFSGLADSRRIDLQLLNRPVSVPGNRSLLGQVINNLLDNAIKYTPAGGRVFVEVGPEAASGRARLSVRDTGVGIPAELVPRVFDRFFRVDKARTKSPDCVGAGLGLSICQAVVAAHHGEIVCDSEPGRGTTFTVTLPMSTQES